MASIIRHTAVWTGAPGLPGYTQFYQEVGEGVTASAQAGHTNVDAFFNALATLIPDAITVTVDPVYQVLDEATGEVTGEETVATPATATVGGYITNWQAQVGVLVEWTTGEYLNGRRFRGRTYLVPLGNTADDDGTLPAGTLSTVGTAAAVIVDSGWGFLVWHRPVNGAGGLSSHITGAVVRDHAAILRSRMI